jgi:hypothetical protein
VNDASEGGFRVRGSSARSFKWGDQQLGMVNAGCRGTEANPEKLRRKTTINPELSLPARLRHLRIGTLTKRIKGFAYERR